MENKRTSSSLAKLAAAVGIAIVGVQSLLGVSQAHAFDLFKRQGNPDVENVVKLYERYRQEQSQGKVLGEVYDAKQGYYAIFSQKPFTAQDLKKITDDALKNYPDVKSVYLFNVQDLTKAQVYDVKTKQFRTVDVSTVIYSGLCKDGHRLSVDATKNFTYSYYMPEEKTAFLFLNRSQGYYNPEQAVKDAINAYGRDTRVVAVEVGSNRCTIAENGRINHVTLTYQQLQNALNQNQGFVNNVIHGVGEEVDRTTDQVGRTIGQGIGHGIGGAIRDSVNSIINNVFRR